jgi:hypothetical protein
MTTKREEGKALARATWLTERLGKGLTSTEDELEELEELVQPGKVERRRKTRVDRNMAMKLIHELVRRGSQPSENGFLEWWEGVEDSE